MKLLRLTTITDDNFASSSVPENDRPVYTAGTTYAFGDEVIYYHRIYRSTANDNLGNDPRVRADKWVATGPTNRWAMFDRAIGTLTEAGTTLTVVLTPGYIDALAMLETQATSARVTMTSNDTVVYDKELTFESGGKAITDWYQYFFAPVGRIKSMVLENLPMYPNGIVTVTLNHEENVECGVLMVGTMSFLGDTLSRPQLSFVDYSRKNTNEFGVTDVVERPWAKKAAMQVKVPTTSVDDIMTLLASVRARPSLYIGENKLDWLRVYGITKRAEAVIEYVDYSILALDIEGLI